RNCRARVWNAEGLVWAQRSAHRRRDDLRVRARLYLRPRRVGSEFCQRSGALCADYARNVLRLSYAASVIHGENVRSRRVAERSGAWCAGQMEVIGLTWDRYVWPLTACAETRLQPASTR